MALRTDYTDAVFTGNRKYRMINNSDGTISLEDVTEYSQLDTALVGAVDMNNTNTAVNSNTTFREAFRTTTNGTAMLTFNDGITTQSFQAYITPYFVFMGGRFVCEAGDIQSGVPFAVFKAGYEPLRPTFSVVETNLTETGAVMLQAQSSGLYIYGNSVAPNITSIYFNLCYIRA